MSRALIIAAPEADVAKLCAKHGIPVSAIEALASGGSRVVFMNGSDAGTIEKAFGSKVIGGAVTRVPTRLVRG